MLGQKLVNRRNLVRVKPKLAVDVAGANILVGMNTQCRGVTRSRIGTC